MATKNTKEVNFHNLSEAAQKLFDKLAQENAKILDVSKDNAILAIYCEQVIKLKNIRKAHANGSDVYKTFNGNWAMHPIAQTKKMCENTIIDCAKELGFTPRARDRAKLAPKETTKSKAAMLREKNLSKNK